LRAPGPGADRRKCRGCEYSETCKAAKMANEKRNARPIFVGAAINNFPRRLYLTTIFPTAPYPK
jgi:hypothetical protein